MRKISMKQANKCSPLVQQIVGCDAEIEEKQNDEYGQRKGSTYILHPRSGSASLNAGTELQIKVIGKTWKYTRGFRRPVFASFSFSYTDGNSVLPMPMCG